MPNIATKILLKKFHPDNPQRHSEQHDLPKIRQSLLSFGWLQYVTLQKNGYILSGHGRVLSANWLNDQPQEYFDEQLSLASGVVDNERFKASYWETCPVIEVDLDDATQRAALIRLNDKQYDGTPDRAKIALLLSKMPAPQQDIAGFSKEIAKSYVDAYIVQQRETQQTFDEDSADDSEDNFSEDDDAEVSELSRTPQRFNVEASGIALDDLDLDELDKDEFRGASIDKDVAETRIVLGVSSLELAEYKTKILAVANHIGIDTKTQANVWRPQTVMRLLRSNFDSIPVTEISEESTTENEEDLGF